MAGSLGGHVRELGELLNVLSCDIGARPDGAPGFDDIRPYLLTVDRDETKLKLTFDASAASAVGAFVAAETLCCGGVGWQFQATPTPTVTVEAPSAQLEALEAMWETTPA